MRIKEILNEASDFDLLADLNTIFANMRKTAITLVNLKKNSRTASDNFKNPSLVNNIIKENVNIQRIENVLFEVIDDMIREIDESDLDLSTKQKYSEMFLQLKKYIDGTIEETSGNMSAIPGIQYSQIKKSKAISKIETLLR